MAHAFVEQDVDFHVVLQLGEHGNSHRLVLPPSQAMQLATELIRASLDARFRNANADTPDQPTDVVESA